MNNIKRLIFFISILFLLTGCTQTKKVVPILDSPELPIKEIEAEKKVPERPNQEYQVRTESNVTKGKRVGVCWKESVEEDCAYTPKNPKDETIGSTRLFANKEEEIAISITSDMDETHLEPHQVEVFQYEFRDEEGEFIESEMDRRFITFTAPDEEGTYYYLLHVIWDEEKTKRAYYAFEIRVK